MKKIICFLLLILVAEFLFAQTPKETPVKEAEPEVVEEEAPVFMDQSIEEEIAIEAPVPNYNSTYNTNKKYITERINTDFELVYERYADSYKKKYGVLKKGEMFLPMIFKKSYSYYNPTTNSIILGLGNSFGLYNLELEEWTIPFEYTSLTLMDKNIYIAKKGRKMGILDNDNNIIEEFKWSAIAKIYGLENYVLVTDFSKPASLKGVYSIITNSTTIPAVYKSVTKLSEGNYFKVKNEFDQMNIVDIKNRPRFKTWYDEIYEGKKGRKHYVVKKDEKMGIIDEDEKSIVPIEYQFIKSGAYNDGSYLAKNKEGKYGCLTIDGKVTLPFVYDNMDIQSYGSLAITKQGGKCGIVQVNNGLPFEIATCDYDDISKGQKIFIVEQGGKYGVMDLYGKMKTKLEFDNINVLSNELLVAKKKNKFQLLDMGGAKISEKAYDEIDIVIDHSKKQYSYSAPTFTYLKVKIGKKKYALLDKLGNKIEGHYFEDVISESQNMIIVKKDGKLGLFNLLNKKLVVPYEYDQISDSNGTLYGFKGNDVYLISTRNGSVKKL